MAGALGFFGTDVWTNTENFPSIHLISWRKQSWGSPRDRHRKFYMLSASVLKEGSYDFNFWMKWWFACKYYVHPIFFHINNSYYTLPPLLGGFNIYPFLGNRGNSSRGDTQTSVNLQHSSAPPGWWAKEHTSREVCLPCGLFPVRHVWKISSRRGITRTSTDSFQCKEQWINEEAPPSKPHNHLGEGWNVKSSESRASPFNSTLLTKSTPSLLRKRPRSISLSVLSTLVNKTPTELLYMTQRRTPPHPHPWRGHFTLFWWKTSQSLYTILYI